MTLAIIILSVLLISRAVSGLLLAHRPNLIRAYFRPIMVATIADSLLVVGAIIYIVTNI
jgi:hypothetical protein